MVAPVAGIKALRKIQAGIETTHGSNVSATARWVGTLGMKLEQKYYRPDDLETGRLSSYERSHVVGAMAKLPFQAEANYEQLGYFLGMAIKGGVTATGGASPYTWTYAPNLTSANNTDSYTVEYGDDVQAFKSNFVFAQSLELSGSLDDTVKVKADLVGQTVATTTFTNSINPPATLTPVITGTGKFYIDTSWAGLGGTEAEATLVDFSWKLTEGIKPVKYLSGVTYFTDRGETKRHVELEATLAFNSNATGLWAKYIASPQTTAYCRIKFTGPAITGGNDTLTLDGAYIVDDFDTLAERDGQDVVKVKLVSIYDTTGTAEFSVSLQNALAALP